MGMPLVSGNSDGLKGRLTSVLKVPEVGIRLGSVLVCVAISFGTPYFLGRRQRYGCVAVDLIDRN